MSCTISQISFFLLLLLIYIIFKRPFVLKSPDPSNRFSSTCWYVNYKSEMYNDIVYRLVIVVYLKWTHMHVHIPVYRERENCPQGLTSSTKMKLYCANVRIKRNGSCTWCIAQSLCLSPSLSLFSFYTAASLTWIIKRDVRAIGCTLHLHIVFPQTSDRMKAVQKKTKKFNCMQCSIKNAILQCILLWAKSIDLTKNRCTRRQKSK